MQIYGINIIPLLLACAFILCVLRFGQLHRKRQAQKFIPRLRYLPHTPEGNERRKNSFFVCPECGYLADAACACPECSLVKPVHMEPGDPSKLEQYLQRQTIFYGAPLE